MSLVEQGARIAGDSRGRDRARWPARRDRDPVRRDLAGGGRPQDLRRGGGRDPRTPDRRGRADRHDTRGRGATSPAGASFSEARDRADSLGISVAWDPELPKTPDGYYQVQGGIDYAIAKSLAAAPFADMLWMETKTADLEDARRFAEAIHAEYPGQDAGLQPVAVVQLGYHRAERRRDAPVPRGAREAGLRVQLHHLRRAPDRRPRRRGVRDSPARRRDARPCPPPAEVPAARVALSNAAVTRRRRPAGRGVDGRLRADRGDQGDGQGIDPAPAPRPDRGADRAARGVACRVGEALGSAGQAPRRAAAPHARVPTSSSFGCRTKRATRWPT